MGDKITCGANKPFLHQWARGKPPAPAKRRRYPADPASMNNSAVSAATASALGKLAQAVEKGGAREAVVESRDAVSVHRRQNGGTGSSSSSSSSMSSSSSVSSNNLSIYNTQTFIPGRTLAAKTLERDAYALRQQREKEQREEDSKMVEETIGAEERAHEEQEHAANEALDAEGSNHSKVTGQKGGENMAVQMEGEDGDDSGRDTGGNQNAMRHQTSVCRSKSLPSELSRQHDERDLVAPVRKRQHTGTADT